MTKKNNSNYFKAFGSKKEKNKQHKQKIESCIVCLNGGKCKV